MKYFLLMGGILLVLSVIADVASTTIAPHGAGKLTQNLSRFVWNVFRFTFHKVGQKNLLNYSGLVIIIALLFMWLMLLWIGYTMIYLSFEGSVVNNRTNEIASVTDTIYFIGYSLSTLGYGDYSATTPILKILSSVISFNGLIMISTIVAYLVPVTMGELQKRKLSSYIAALGKSPTEILVNGWNGKNFSKLHRHFDTIINMLLEVGQSHLAYPILHYFHTSNKQQALAIYIAALDEALTLLICYVPEKHRLLDHEILPLRQTITSFLLTIHSSYLRKIDQAPPDPDVSELIEHKIPINGNPKECSKCLKKLSKRRRYLYALVEADCWKWTDMKHTKFKSDLEII